MSHNIRVNLSWDIIAHSYTNFNSCIAIFYNGCNYLSMFESKLIDVSKISPWNNFPTRYLRVPLQWRQNGRDSDSNHQPHDCLLNRLFRRRSKKTSNLRVTGLCAGKSPGTGEFPARMASNAENVSIWWRHHDLVWCDLVCWTENDNQICVDHVSECK